MAEKEAILILSYFFPPCNMTPSERVYSWAKYLKNGNYYPIILTRNWDTKISNSTTDAFKSSGTEIKIEKYPDYEVHYLPYKSSLKDKIFLKFDGTAFYIIYLAAAFFYNILQLIFLRLSPYYFFYPYTKKILADRKIKKMVVSASPFELFGIAYFLHKKTNIQWIADYRDDWSTNEMQFADSLPKRIILKIHRFYEKKFLKTCSSFTTVSQHYIKKIGALLQKKGFLVENGYLPENYNISTACYKNFTISYSGSIYSTQPIELFLTGIKSFINARGKEVKLTIYFIGIANEAAILKRIEKQIIGYESYFIFTQRLPKKEAIDIQARSHLLLACAYGNLKGIPGSKLYEYIALRKPVIVYPSDSDVIEQTLLDTKQGLICRNENDFLKFMNDYYEKYEQTEQTEKPLFDEAVIKKYSREEQTKELINALNEIQ